MASGIKTMAEVLDELGGIPLDRILFRPAPGTATEQDVLELERRENRLCELVDGVLVEKAMGYEESIVAGAILSFLRAFVIPRNLGQVSGADGMMRLFSGLVRIPDVAFASWSRFPDGKLIREPIPDLAPDLAVEVLSSTNTASEMDRKCREYFAAGVHLVWLVDPATRTISVFSSLENRSEMTASDTLDGDAVLPGFSVAVRDLFADLDRESN